MNYINRNAIIIGLILLAVDVGIIVWMPLGIVKEILIAIISIFVGTTGLSLVGLLEERRERLRIIHIQEQVIERFNNFFKVSLGFSLTVKGLGDVEGEHEVLRIAINQQQQKIHDNKVNSLVLCYYCRKWNNDHNSSDYDKIKIESENLRVRYAEVTIEVHDFLVDYRKLVMEEDNELPDEEILREFTDTHYRELQYYKLRSQLELSRGLHETLVEIIQLGELSNFGINEETITRLRQDVMSYHLKQGFYLILYNKLPAVIRKYIESFPGFKRVGITPKIPGMDSRFGAYLVRFTDIQNPQEVVNAFKFKITDIDEECLVYVVALDTSTSEVLAVPEDRQFNSRGLRASNEIIQWIDSGYVLEESALWNEIASSKITPNELLSVIPFNVFCRNIRPTEQAFLIEHYAHLKEYFHVDTLDQWRNIDSHLMQTELLQFDLPKYDSNETANILKLKEGTDDALQEAIQTRIFSLCVEICDGARSFYESIQYQHD